MSPIASIPISAPTPTKARARAADAADAASTASSASSATSASSSSSTSTLAKRYSLQPASGVPRLPDEPVGCATLIGCFSHLALCNAAGPRFPPKPQPAPSTPLGSREEQRRIYLGPKLSARATGGPDAGPLIERFSCLFKDQYNCKHNPRGIVSLGVAENFLLEKECLEYFTHAFQHNFLASDLSYGDGLWGSRRINRALAGFLNDYFDPAHPVLPDQLITGVGCSAVLDQLFHTLMDEGEAVLLAAPYYTGFDRDLIGRARVSLVPVDLPADEAFAPSSLSYFAAKADALAAQGVTVRAVIVCNPHNPLGRTYPRDTLLAYARFCEERDLHLVSDEIYAMSVYGGAGFTSMLSLDVERELGGGGGGVGVGVGGGIGGDEDQVLGQGEGEGEVAGEGAGKTFTFDRARLHVVYGMSKDFCANGLRVGALVSQANPLLLRAMAGTSMLMKISSPADVIWSALLTDEARLAEFVALNRARLAEAAAYVRAWFEARGVHVAPSNAGNFVWVDIGGRLGFRDAMEEKRVFQRLLDGGVYVAPGTAYHNSEAGWFRITFSVARDNLNVGLGKIERLLDLYPLKA
ncbi:PLP-dependent transferase [Cutaneotrichosporon oleaginosum]|uniref:PLP-dependent transferase n=1 Tax=Cutaneotrichosporon oleaginosum TaxID=879819 RepID=A0A0J0XBN3_9TREE|nr:PLP-dependent transferase [Cutaneotrichosporon oleaginosum]KLT38485.1 PLP-dependent transferase [Cutaneotrichosporon oleaginosum]TXT12165.1 hypothetical protein COLE_02575 [Cutaneotrichosporon oleaginosum]